MVIYSDEPNTSTAITLPLLNPLLTLVNSRLT